MMRGFTLLAKLNGLRGTPFDLFGYTRERRMERRLIEEYRETIATLLDRLDEENYDAAVQVASLPADIRGFGHVKEEAVGKAQADKKRLMKAFRQAGRTIASDSAVQYQEVG